MYEWWVKGCAWQGFWVVYERGSLSEGVWEGCERGVWESVREGFREVYKRAFQRCIREGVMYYVLCVMSYVLCVMSSPWGYQAYSWCWLREWRCDSLATIRWQHVGEGGLGEGGLKGWIVKGWIERVYCERVCWEGMLRGCVERVCWDGGQKVSRCVWCDGHMHVCWEGASL